MATSMQFGPEWMRKGPNSKSGGKESTTPSTATSPGSGPIAGNAAAPGAAGAGGGKRNGGSGGGLANLSGPAPVVSPAVSSPGAFSFAAAAAAAASAATSQAADRNGIHASYAAGDADASAALLNGTSAALAKDKLTREKLLSLYSADRTSKAPSAEPSPIDAAPPGPIGANAGPERAPSTSRRKTASDRRPSAFADFGAVGGGGGGPLSPALAGSEPRGLNARSTSGSSASGVAGGFGSMGASNWDKPDKERPGLFQRASSGALAGVGASAGSRPLSPNVSRDRFSGIQGGVLSGVAPPARKRMDSSDGGVAANSIESSSRAARIGKGGASEENGTPQPANSLGGSWGRASQAGSAQPATTGANNPGFSEAFSSNRARGRNASAAADSSVTPAALTVQSSSEPAQPIVPSAHPEGLSISAKFARHKDRLPGEGPIGPPSDGSIGFGKSAAGFDRRRERQTSQARPVQSLSASKQDASHSNPLVSSSIAEVASAEKADAQSADPNGNFNAASRTLGSDDPDLAQQASAVLGSLHLDDDDSPGLPPINSSINTDQAGTNNNDARHSLQSQQQQQQPFHSLQPPMAAAPWSPETAMWLYRDMAGNVQGPFSSLMMHDWYSQQYFADDLLIRRQEDSEFKPLAQVVAAIGNALQPFIIPPSNWLHRPDPPRPAFDNNMATDSLLGNEQSRFTDAFDANRPWSSGQAGRQQAWPASLALGGLANGGPSPFGHSDIFAAGQAGFDNRPRNQDELMSILREREMHDQQRAAAAAAAAASRGPGGMSLGQLDGFGGGLGRSGWAPESAMTPSHWGGLGQPGLGQFGDVGLGGHQSPLVNERAAFDNFNQQQRQAFEQAGSPWANKASLAQRSQFDSTLGGGGARQVQGQWGEQQAPWSFGAGTPGVAHREMEFGDVARNEAIKAADPIGTPRRARSPAPHHDTTLNTQLADQRDEQHQSFENAFPAPVHAEQHDDVETAPAADIASAAAVEDKSAAEEAMQAAKTATPQKKQSKKEAQKAAAAAAAVASEAQQPSQPATSAETEIPPPEAFTTGEPRPEELWPQSPKAVEFASEPELSGMPALTLPTRAAKEAKREPRSALARPSTDAPRPVPGSAEPANRAASAAAARSTGAGNVRVVSQDQFRRTNKDDVSSTATQAPLSDWLTDASAAEAQTAASRPAPWAAKEDAAQPTGPSLREIQEAEAKRAEAKRAADKAAARARMAASPSAVEDLPTTLSWGLASAPAAKAGSGAGSDAGAATAPAAPAWNAGKSAPKKTLMEIQEEERKRADKVKAQQSALAAAARKGYADSAGRTPSASLHGVVAPASSASSGGGAWSVVGASGKPTTPSAAPAVGTGSAYGSAAASPLAARPALGTPSRSTSGAVPTSGSGSAWNVVGKPSAPASPSPSSRTAAPSSALASAAKRAPLDPNAPSPEFIRYCKDNLQGLTIKTDDFIDMLLQFPLDPSADVIEIIADTVYANSSTLDGRRFAHDFVSKRKLDVHGRTGSTGASRWGAASAAGMGNFGAVKPVTTQQASPFGAKAMNAVPKSPDSGFRVVKSKAAKKRT
ncbi:uncharacterized protein PAN0_008c3621 [Moesziomyces antarcticus]|uniref:Uncharacterized protein n=2 Tax=Pseudozyma antarctica TaxID=84753 RepID=A0A081CFF8_PSEA2|nr:uncharacterized protein PAN0_008c3621 [Moesziomyces antarcticus]GAK65404.1 conserved hypothetical protein [Moesziomyces antarcticus]SPO46411.1 uncharacterized protein PSANT_04097 [Moesziomyces antarcticus]